MTIFRLCCPRAPSDRLSLYSIKSSTHRDRCNRSRCFLMEQLFISLSVRDEACWRLWQRGNHVRLAWKRIQSLLRKVSQASFYHLRRFLQPWTETWSLPHRLSDQDTCLSGLHCSESRIASDFFLRACRVSPWNARCSVHPGRLQPITTWRLFRFMSRQLLMRCLNFKTPLSGIALGNVL